MLPVRYQTDLWDRQFRAQLSAALRPGLVVLDVGGGRRPTLAIEDRPTDTHYVGLDIDAAELNLAAAGSYDELVVGAAEDHVESLVGRVDLIVSFFAIEHVRSSAATFINLAAYLRPGGRLIMQMAGANSPFSLVNRLFSTSTAARLLAKTQERPPESVFPARYDNCSYSGLTGILATGWAEARIVPLFTGAGYVLFSRVLTAAYIGYEEWMYRCDQKNLAPYYLVIATR